MAEGVRRVVLSARTCSFTAASESTGAAAISTVPVVPGPDGSTALDVVGTAGGHTADTRGWADEDHAADARVTAGLVALLDPVAATGSVATCTVAAVATATVPAIRTRGRETR